MIFALLLAVLTLPHGGQYLPPLHDPETPSVLPSGVPTSPDAGEPVQLPTPQPGSGPTMGFSPGRWEWWFDFNQEQLLDLRRRLAQAAPRSYQPATDEDRERTLRPVLLEALKAKPRDVRAAAAMALGRLALPSSLPALQEIAADPDLFVRAQGVLALGILGSPAATEGLGEILGNNRQSAEMRLFSAVALALVGGPEVDTLLGRELSEAAFKHHGNLIRAGLVYAAGVSASPGLAQALDALRTTYLVRNDASLRALIAVAFGQQSRAQGVAPVLALLSDKDNGVRRSSASALYLLAAHLSPAQQLTLAKHLKGESDLTVRTGLLKALGRAGSPVSGAHLRAAFKDSRAIVRPHAALALGFDANPQNRPLLLAAFENTQESSLRSALAVSLGLIGNIDDGPPLAKLLIKTRNPALGGYLSLALGLIGAADEQALQTIAHQAASSHIPEVVRFSMLALGMLGARDAIDELAAGLPEIGGTMDRAVRIHALGLVGDRSTLQTLIDVVQDPRQPAYVVTFALQALGELGDPRPMSAASRLSRGVDLDHDVAYIRELYYLL
jgi:HEAT repeat protein